MRIGISANSLNNRGYGRWGEKAYCKLKEHGFSCSDFNMMNTETVIYKEEEATVKSLLTKERTLADESGIKIIQAHGPWAMPIREVTPEGKKERMEKMKKSIYFASVLGAENWVIHPIMPYGIEEKNTENAKRTYESNFDFFRELLKTAKEYGITICLENMPFDKFSLSTPEEILDFVNEINDDNFRICLDTGHVAAFCDLNLADETRRLGKKIKALHVHDSREGLDLHLMPYYGKIDWSGFAKALKDINFKGCFSYETSPPPQLSDELYEDAALLLNKIAKELVFDI